MSLPSTSRADNEYSRPTKVFAFTLVIFALPSTFLYHTFCISSLLLTSTSSHLFILQTSVLLPYIFDSTSFKKSYLFFQYFADILLPNPVYSSLSEASLSLSVLLNFCSHLFLNSWGVFLCSYYLLSHLISSSVYFIFCPPCVCSYCFLLFVLHTLHLFPFSIVLATNILKALTPHCFENRFLFLVLHFPEINFSTDLLTITFTRPRLPILSDNFFYSSLLIYISFSFPLCNHKKVTINVKHSFCSHCTQQSPLHNAVHNYILRAAHFPLLVYTCGSYSDEKRCLVKQTCFSMNIATFRQTRFFSRVQYWD